MPILAETEHTVEDKPYKERLIEELTKSGQTQDYWSATTGINLDTIKNLMNPKRSAGTVRATYLNAFWKAEPTIDLHYIITGERTAPKVYIRTEGQVEIVNE